jgi:hypothetical protein
MGDIFSGYVMSILPKSHNFLFAGEFCCEFDHDEVKFTGISLLVGLTCFIFVFEKSSILLVGAIQLRPNVAGSQRRESH